MKLRPGRPALILFGAALAILAAWFGARWAVAAHGPALLDWADRQSGPDGGYRLALADGHYGALPAQKIEVIVPDRSGPGPWPVVAFIHGGSWESGQPGNYRFIGRQLARKGYAVALLGYRLGSEGRFPIMLEDGASALAWIRDNAARFGGDPRHVCLMGHSAGAYNAMMLALDRQWLGRAGIEDGFVQGVVGLAGPYDFYPITSDSARNAFGAVKDPATTQPINFVRGDAPPMLLLAGADDQTVKPRNTRALGKALAERGAVAEQVILPGLTHNDPVRLLAAPFNRDQQVATPILSFLARHCRASAPVQAGPG